MPPPAKHQERSIGDHQPGHRGVDPVDLERGLRHERFGELAAMVHMAGEAPDIIDLYVFRSYAVFAWDWLVATAPGAARIRLFEPQAAPTA